MTAPPLLDLVAGPGFAGVPGDVLDLRGACPATARAVGISLSCRDTGLGRRPGDHDAGAVVRRALTVRSKFADHEVRNYGRERTTEEVALGLVKDVGDLAMMVRASGGVRHVNDLD